ncbi:MAG: MFS transporter [Thermomicrobiales bacterium]
MRDQRTWAAYLLLGLFAYMETAVGPVMPFLRAELGLSYAVASLHFSAFAIGAIISGLLGERVVRRIGRPAALWGGMAGMCGGLLLIGLSPVVAGTILGAFCMGLLGTLSLMANQAVLADIHGAQRTIALTESNVAATACAVLAPLIVGALAGSGLGWPLALLLSAPWLAALWLIFRRAQFPPARPPRAASESRQTLPPAFWVLALVLFLVASVEWCIAYWGAEFLASVVGLNRAFAASAMTLFFIAMAGGRLIGSRLAWRFPSAQLLYVALVIAIGGFLLFWLSSAAVPSLIGLFVAGLGVANFYPLTVGVATGAVPDLIDTATARLAVAGGSALLFAPLLVGAIADAVGMRWGFGVVAPLLVGACFSLYAAMRMVHVEGQAMRLPGPPNREQL